MRSSRARARARARRSTAQGTSATAPRTAGRRPRARPTSARETPSSVPARLSSLLSGTRQAESFRALTRSLSGTPRGRRETLNLATTRVRRARTARSCLRRESQCFESWSRVPLGRDAWPMRTIDKCFEIARTARTRWTHRWSSSGAPQPLSKTKRSSKNNAVFCLLVSSLSPVLHAPPPACVSDSPVNFESSLRPLHAPPTTVSIRVGRFFTLVSRSRCQSPIRLR